MNVNVEVNGKKRFPLEMTEPTTDQTATKRAAQIGRKGDSETMVRRSAFLYFGPDSPTKKHGQCSSCMLYLGEDARLCAILGKRVDVSPEHSCGLYVHGKPNPDQEAVPRYRASEVGLYEGKVRCENCMSYKPKDSTCTFFEMLNKKLSETFKLRLEVHKRGCCNAFRQTEGAETTDGRDAGHQAD